MWTTVQLALAGIGPLIWHWGLGVGLIICILLAEYFLGYLPFMQRFRKDLLWVAVGIALILAGEWIGKRDGNTRCAAKATVVENVVDKGVAKAHANTKGVDRWDRTKK